MPDEDPLDVNKKWWDESAVDHFERTYELHLLRDGGESLYPIEAAELPADLSGLRGDYMDRGAPRENTVTIEYGHGLGEIVTALTDAGLPTDWLHEHLGVPWQLSPDLIRQNDRLYRRPGSYLPLAYNLRATRT